MLTPRFHLICRATALVVILPVLLLTLDVRAHAQDPQSQAVRLTNLDWRVDGDLVTITYDLVGPPDKMYAVAVVLMRESHPSFKVVPKSLTGNVGIGKFAGTGRLIVWNYRKDVPQGLVGDGYYFEIVAEQTGNGNPWLYYVLGGAAALGGGAALIASKKGGGNGTAAPQELPLPPSRPSQ